MRKLLIGMLALWSVLVAAPLWAATVTATWQYPTMFVDNSPLAPADLASTTVQYGTCTGAAFGASLGAVNVASPLLTATTPNLAPGTYCLRAFVTAVAAKGGGTSAFSNVAQITVPFPSPGAPSSLTVTIP